MDLKVEKLFKMKKSKNFNSQRLRGGKFPGAFARCTNYKKRTQHLDQNLQLQKNGKS